MLHLNMKYTKCQEDKNYWITENALKLLESQQ